MEELKKVLISDPLSHKGLEILARSKNLKHEIKTGLSPEELKKIIPEYDAIIIRSETKLKADIIEAADRLKVIGRAGIGLDNVDLPAATKKGIVVMNTPQENAIAAAEHALALMFSIARKIPQATASMKAGKWEKKKFMGVELYNKTLGVVGIGVIGTIVVDRGRGLKMKVIGYDPFITREVAEKKGFELVSLDELLSRSDFITVHTPLTDETRNLIDKNAMRKMKDGVILINCARGGIVNEKDLYDAVKEGKVAGAALDVFEKEPAVGHPLFELEEVIHTPHLGASTGEAQENVSVAIAQQVVDYLTLGETRNAVNLPVVSPDILPFLRPYLRLGERLGSFPGPDFQLCHRRGPDRVPGRSGRIRDETDYDIGSKRSPDAFCGRDGQLRECSGHGKGEGDPDRRVHQREGEGFCEPDCHYDPIEDGEELHCRNALWKGRVTDREAQRLFHRSHSGGTYPAHP